MSIPENFYRNIAHDFLNITSRLESASSLLEGDAPDPEDLKMITEIFTDSSKKLGEAIHLFCWWQWLENNPDLKIETFDLMLTLQEEVAAFTESGIHKINMQVGCTQAEITADRALIRMFVRELIRNATQHCVADTPISILLKEENGAYHLNIKNTAQAAPHADFKKPLIRHPQSNGLGFGLSLVQSALPILKATVNFEHTENSFEVYVKIPNKA